MKTKTINVYSFDELSDKAKKVAIESFRDVNTSHDWWDGIYDDFKSFCEYIGVSVDTDNTYFTLSYSQSDSAGFSASIDLPKLIEGIENKAYLEYAPEIEKETRFNPSICDVDKRVLALINKGTIEVNCSYYSKSHLSSNWTKVNFDADFRYNAHRSDKNINAELTKLEEWLESIGNDLSNTLYRLLRNECDSQTEDAAIIDTIRANEYEFLPSGKQYRI